MAEYYVNTKDMAEFALILKAGDRVYLSGTAYTARDAAHKRIVDLIEKGCKLPFDLKNSTVYYAGPTPTPEGYAIGSCGPTTSGRMDKFTPVLLDLGLKCIIGKGPRDNKVLEAIVRNDSVYLCAVGGAGALASSCITKCHVIAFDDLGCESVKEIEFDNFPLIVAIDNEGNSLFNQEKHNAFTNL